MDDLKVCETGLLYHSRANPAYPLMLRHRDVALTVRLRDKAEKTEVVFGFQPERFTLSVGSFSTH